MSWKVTSQRATPWLLLYFAKLCSLRELCVKAFAFVLAFLSVIPEGNLLLPLLEAHTLTIPAELQPPPKTDLVLKSLTTNTICTDIRPIWPYDL